MSSKELFSIHRTWPGNMRQLFLQHVGQTSEAPLALQIVQAAGCSLWDADGKEYIDLIGGISVCNVGHRHPRVVEAIKNQADQYLHIMVYGELVETPQVRYATMLAQHLPASLNAIFFTASGSEATEGAMKLCKRYTGRSKIISFRNSYHGSTQGALSLMENEYWQQAFRPLLPGIVSLSYNHYDDLENICDATACVVLETIQAEAGVISPDKEWIQALRKKCSEKGCLLVLDEIQCGFGRNGSLWAFEQFGIEPDVLLLGKALGGGMPMGAFVADKKLMDMLSVNPVLGHISTFGGHPVCCAAGLAAFEALMEEKLMKEVSTKEALFLQKLVHPAIKKINSHGLMLAVHFETFEVNKKIIDRCIELGVFTDWFLFAPHAMRIAPPLSISVQEIDVACAKILKAIEDVTVP